MVFWNRISKKQLKHPLKRERIIKPFREINVNQHLTTSMCDEMFLEVKLL